MWQGSMPRPARTGSRKNRTARPGISKHTSRFRVLFAFDPSAYSGRGANVSVGVSPPIHARNLVKVGAKPRAGRSRSAWGHDLPKKVGLQGSIASGLFAAMAFAASLLMRPAMLSRRQQRKGTP